MSASRSQRAPYDRGDEARGVEGGKPLHHPKAEPDGEVAPAVRFGDVEEDEPLITGSQEEAQS